MAKQKVKIEQRTVDPQGTDVGAATEIEDLAARKKALAGLEPTPPKFGNPVKQIGGALKSITRSVMPRTVATPAEEKTYKLQGERAFYEGKIEKAQKTGSYIPKTSIASLARKRGKK
jgi:hypothetical protein